MTSTEGTTGIGAETGTTETATTIATGTTGTRTVTEDIANMTLGLGHVPAPRAGTLNTNMTGITTTTDAETPDAPPISGAPTIILTLADIDHDISFYHDDLLTRAPSRPDFLWPTTTVSQPSFTCYIATNPVTFMAAQHLPCSPIMTLQYTDLSLFYAVYPCA